MHPTINSVMEKRLLKNQKSSRKELVQAWEQVWTDLNQFNALQGSTLPVLLLVNQKLKYEPVMKAFESLKKSCCKFYDILDALEDENEAVKPVEIKLPWDTNTFKKAWQNWKEYLAEQHGIKISSRTEQKQLENLFKISDKDEKKAQAMIDYSISSFYRTLFKLDEKEKKTDINNTIKRNDNDY